jgi:transcriptional regulator with XRE-family HTH domain
VDFVQAFATTLRTLRVERKLSQEKLAEKAGLHINTISLMERGLRQPTLYSVFQLSVALDLSPPQLIQAIVDRNPEIKTQFGPY